MRVIASTLLWAMLLAGASDATVLDDRAGAPAKEKRMADSNDLETLKQLTGAPYERARDAFLQSRDLPSRIAAIPAPAGDWRDTITRRILAGWSQHAALYRRVLSELDAVDVEQESRKITGITGVWEAFAAKAAAEYKTDILPLCWEALLKHGDDWPDWKLIAFLRATAAVPSRDSVDPVLAFLEGTDDAQLQDVAGQTLLKLPKDAVELRLQRAQAKHGHIVEVLRDIGERLR